MSECFEKEEHLLRSQAGGRMDPRAEGRGAWLG